MVDVHVTDENIEIEKIQKLIEELRDAKGNGDSLLSIIVPRDDDLSRVSATLAFNLSNYVANIENSVNRESAIRAIKSAQQKLQLYSKVPANGLVMYTGTVVSDTGNTKEVSIDFEPFERMHTPLCSLENKFHIEALQKLLEYEGNYIRENDKIIAIWKHTRRINLLKSAKGEDDSLFSLIMKPEYEIFKVCKMLDCILETGPVKVVSAIRAIKSAQQKLQLYSKIPPNGLAIYTGTVVTDDGIEKDFSVDFEPFTLISDCCCLLDSRFHTQELASAELFKSEPTYGFIVMDDTKALLGRLSGNKKQVLEEIIVDPSIGDPSMTHLGGADPEYDFLGRTFCNNSLSRVVDRAKYWYLDYMSISALVIATSPTWNLIGSLDPRLKKIIRCTVELSYGGRHGFDIAIDMASNHLYNVRFVQEIYLLRKFMKEMAQETHKYVIGLEETLSCLVSGAVKILIVWENLEVNRYVLKNTMTEELVTKHLNQEEENDESNFRDSGTNTEMEVQEKTSLLDWFAQVYKEFGCTTLEFVTDSSLEGSQFCRGLGGIGGILHYPVKISSDDDLSDDGENYA